MKTEMKMQSRKMSAKNLKMKLKNQSSLYLRNEVILLRISTRNVLKIKNIKSIKGNFQSDTTTVALKISLDIVRINNILVLQREVSKC